MAKRNDTLTALSLWKKAWPAITAKWGWPQWAGVEPREMRTLELRAGLWIFASGHSYRTPPPGEVLPILRDWARGILANSITRPRQYLDPPHKSHVYPTRGGWQLVGGAALYDAYDAALIAGLMATEPDKETKHGK